MPRISEAAIVDVAFELAEMGGPDSVTMQALAAKLGVKAPSLYAHVRCLDDVKEAVAVRALDRLNAHIAFAAVGRAGIEAGIAIGTAYRAYALEHPGLYQAIMEAPTQGREQVIAANKRVGMTVRQALSAFCETYEDGLDAERYLRSLVHGFISFELAGYFAETGLSCEESFQNALRRALSAYEPRA